MVEKSRIEKPGIEMSFKLIVRGHFNPGLFNHEPSNPGFFNPALGVEKLKVEKSGVEKSVVEMFIVENPGLKGLGFKSPGLKCPSTFGKVTSYLAKLDYTNYFWTLFDLRIFIFDLFGPHWSVLFGKLLLVIILVKKNFYSIRLFLQKKSGIF